MSDSPTAKSTPSPLEIRLQVVLAIANRFLDRLDEGEIEEVWLIGSRAGMVNPAYPERGGRTHDSSDWDFLVVGKDFDEVEREKLDLLESGENIFGLSIDVDVRTRHESNDIIFSSTPPMGGQLLWKKPAL